jgi:hypothetical protein
VAQNDLVSNGGNPHPCIVQYSGIAVNLQPPNYFCSGYAFQMIPGSGYIVLGPTVNISAISYDYDSWTTATVRVFTSTNQGGPWTQVQSFTPNNTQCVTTLTPSIAQSMYYKIAQDAAPWGGGSSGPISIRNIYPETPLPVQLTSFVASKVGARVQLAWKTATEINNYGFEIERQIRADTWETIGFVEGHGTVNTPQSYLFSDMPPASALDVVSYRLRQLDRDGSFEYSPVVSVTMAAAKTFGLRSAYPNPFNPATTLSFTVPQPTTATLAIFDRSGREVARIVNNAALSAGSYSYMFSATGLPSGEYYAWLFSGTESSVMAISLVK